MIFQTLTASNVFTKIVTIYKLYEIHITAYVKMYKKTFSSENILHWDKTSYFFYDGKLKRWIPHTSN